MYKAWFFQKPEVRGQISEVRKQTSENRSKELKNLHFFHQYLPSILYYLPPGFRIPHSQFGFRVFCHPSSVFCFLSSFICLLFPVPIDLIQYLRGHIISQLHRFISMFGSQIIRPFFQVSDGQIIVGRRKVSIEFNCL